MYESFDEYLGYLDTIKGEISRNVYEFASDLKRHELENAHSLHDSWITSISVQEKRNPSRPFEPEVIIVLELLGQMHDRDIVLEYKEVKAYRIESIENPYNSGDTFHGDVISHEVRLVEHDLLIHEIVMATDKTIEIVCKNFSCNESIHT